MKTIITCVARGHWYPRGVERMLDRFDRVYGSDLKSAGIQFQMWIDELPLGAPEHVVEDTIVDCEGGQRVWQWDYTAYCAKPFALSHALFQSDADVAILLDAAFYPIRRIEPLIEHIAKVGYYLCDNGAPIGEWSSDRALKLMNLRREDAFQMTEVSSYCVGLSRRHFRSLQFTRGWCDAALVRGIFEGPHTAGEVGELGKRNPGWVSNDPRVKGHRHDQTAASIIAWRLGMRSSVPRPIFTAYERSQDERTVLCNQGM